ncbi:MAG TPA: APC family permease [Candidatus Binatia bacterium]|nr:APC family permease [Candidatus Binatia bacterium]
MIPPESHLVEQPSRPSPSARRMPLSPRFQRLRTLLVGKPKDPLAPDVFHKVSLAAFLAWVGLGSDGLSSSAYGPDEAFRALGEHTYLAVALAGATAFTVFIISYAYSRIIEHFPFGGGGYVVASRLLGPRLGVVSGSALLVDYVLTISVSIAAAADATFSLLPAAWHPCKVPVEFALIGVFMVLNLRGVKESVTALMPIFLLFIVTHAVFILGTILWRAGEIRDVAREVHGGFRSGMVTLGWGGLAALFLHAYTRGAGTYTGIEAVSNGLQIMREPRVETGRRTMLYMAVSLAVTASGILLCYLLVHAAPVEGKTLNAVLVGRFAGDFQWAGLPLGHWFLIVTLASETAILAVAAQTGFIDGPRVMANMATDSWLPHSFSHLSERLSMQNGVLLMSGAAVLTLLYTWGETSTLVLMYSINVFLTFSLSESGMVRYWFRHRATYPDWSRHIIIHIIGLLLCSSILVVSIVEKFSEGGWITLVITAAVIGLCLFIHRHYRQVQENLRSLDEVLLDELPLPAPPVVPARDPQAPTAVFFVNGYNGLGMHSVLTVPRLFGTHFRNFVFVGVGVIDSSRFKSREDLTELRQQTEEGLQRYVTFVKRQGVYAEYWQALGTDLVDELERLAHEVVRRFPRAVFFAGQLIFQQPTFWDKVLHNQTAFTLQRRLQFGGLQMTVLPIRVGAGPA